MIEERTKINKTACITFKQRTTEANYVYVHNGIGCYSEVEFLALNYINCDKY